ncbi:MAG: NifB/NifX family molybdenum-iron cluster-binding protein [Bacteroidales bacterium]
MKKIAVPLQNNQLCSHFGHSENFAIYETDDSKIIGRQILTPPPHEPGSIPRWLHEQGVTDIIAGGIGQRAIQILLANSINVYVGVAPKAGEELVEDLLNNNLQAGVNLCDH